VTEKLVTIAGAVIRPATFKVPIGTSFADCIELAGGAIVTNYAILVGGAMMGEAVTDFNIPVTKTTAGLIVLPREHALVRRRLLSKKAVKTIGASVCDQCYRCTELCPRWLLGYHIEPHQVMRSLLFGAERWDEWSLYSLNCCECNICSLYACPEDLDPKNITAWAKKELMARGIRPDKKRRVRENPTRFGRQVPTRLLTQRLGLRPYDVEAPYTDVDFYPERVRIPLRQHIGVQATPVIRAGDRVKKGEMIGDIGSEDMGARVHASIDGEVEAVDNYVTIVRE
jgi:Na+-translocating ferredoxin:NAD+ oxidoreductase RnfC subunit